MISEKQIILRKNEVIKMKHIINTIEFRKLSEKQKAEVIAYDDLGAEAIRRLEVEDFPAIVIIDSEGNNLYETGRAAYLAQK